MHNRKIYAICETLMIIDAKYIVFLEEMLVELAECKLEVCLVPSKIPESAADGAMIRIVTSINPSWYSELASMYPKVNQRKRKKPQTSIRRDSIISAIACMIKNKKSNSKYACFLLAVAEYRLETVLYEMSDAPF